MLFRSIALLCEYDFAYEFYGGLAAVKKNGKYGYINTSGEVVIQYEYDYAGYFRGDLAIVQKNGKYGYINKSGTAVVPCEYDDGYRFYGDLAVVRKDGWDDGKWGVVNKNGTFAAPCEYDYAESYYGNLAVVQKGRLENRRYGVIRGGELVLPAEYESIRVAGFMDSVSYVWAKKDGEWGIIVLGDTSVTYTKAEVAELDELEIKSKGITVTLSDKIIASILGDADSFTAILGFAENGFGLAFLADGSPVDYNDPLNPIKVTAPVSGDSMVAKLDGKYLPYSVTIDEKLIMLLAGTGQVVWTQNPVKYTDEIPFWATGHIGFVGARELFVGDEKGQYMPYVKLSLGQIVTVMAKLDLDDLSVYKDDSRYGGNKWYSRPMMWAEDNGIVKPGSDPTVNTPREDVAVAFYNYIVYKKAELPVKAENKDIVFEDASGITEANREKVSSIVKWGIMTGERKKDAAGIEKYYFNPQKDITRSELAAVFSNLINAMLK